jgi:murein DD-endopeptidase MepM/ murein hydrolase activator NlpD
VSRGDQLSLIGQTGNATGPHTHFEVAEVLPPVADNQHTRIRFQVLFGPNKVQKGCYIPRKGETFASTNG